jgi:Fe-S-cluster containining protein
MLSDEERTEFHAAVDSVQRVVVTHLEKAHSAQHAIAFVSNLHRGVDRVFQDVLDKGQDIACKAGCNYCCSVRVHATEPEIFLIAAQLRERPADQLKIVLNRLKDHAALASLVSTANHRTACPFLDASLCSIYAVRPAVCRKAHSLDAQLCEKSSAELPQSLNILLKAEALMKGTAEAYLQVGLPASSHEFGQAVLLALTDDSTQQRWYAGFSPPIRAH